MGNHDAFPIVAGSEAVSDMQAVATVDLGPTNVGAFGPTDETVRQWEDLEKAVAAPEWRTRLPETETTWICVDVRTMKGRPEWRTSEGVGQSPGTPVFTKTTADLMDPRTVGEVKVTELVGSNTRETIADGDEVIVHGHDHGDTQEARKRGCAANTTKRSALRHNAANIDEVQPLVWHLSTAFGLDRWITPEDVIDSIRAGAENAEDDSVWEDADPAHLIDIAVANGAKYAELNGVHTEEAVGVTMDKDEGLDTHGFTAAHHDSTGKPIGLFGATLGRYVHSTMLHDVRRGMSPRDAALRAMRGITDFIGVPKEIGTPQLKAIALGEAQKVEL